MVDLEEEEREEFIETETPKRKPPSWKRVFVALFFVVVGCAGVMSFFNDDLTTPIEQHLKALRENRLTEAYYRYTTHEFQEGTTLPSFREFVHAHPVLFHNKGFKHEDSHSQSSFGLIQGRVIGQDGSEAPIEYSLKREGGRWRIIAIKLSPEQKVVPTKRTVVANDMVEPVEHQLQALKRKDISSAYNEITSNEFKKNTSLTEFKRFVERYPALFDHDSITYKSHTKSSSEGSVIVELIAGDQLYSVNYKLVKTGKNWKIWNMRLVAPIAKESHVLNSNLNAIKQPIINQLNALKKDQLENAYNNSVAEDFKKVTSFKDFENFFYDFPILTEYESLEIGDVVMDDDRTGVMEVDFYSPNGMTVIEYTLAEEQGEWKILGIKVVQHKQFNSSHINTKGNDHNTSKGEIFHIEALASVIEGQLEAVKAGMVKDAYQSYTAKGFREATSLEIFESFMKKHPAFVNNRTGKFSKLDFNNNVGTVKGALITRTGVWYPVEYDLVLEEGDWKILHVEVHPPSDNIAINKDAVDEGKQIRAPKNAELKIVGVDIGNEVDTYGIVRKPLKVLPRDTADIFVNVKVLDAKIGTVIEMLFRHLNSGAQIQPVSTTLKESGRSVVSFVYSPPKKGWPPGQYKLIVKTSTGQEKTLEFEVK